MIEIELERTYLAKNIPPGLADSPFRQIVDLYLPAKDEHPKLRLRKSGDTYAITKKAPLHGDDSSEQAEHTIPLTEEEYAAFAAMACKKVEKKRYYYTYGVIALEVDIFEGGLTGLVLIDVEFKSTEEKKKFSAPAFCLAEVTQEAFVAGGMLAGKAYEDVEEDLARFGYQKLFF